MRCQHFCVLRTIFFSVSIIRLLHAARQATLAKSLFDFFVRRKVGIYQSGAATNYMRSKFNKSEFRFRLWPIVKLKGIQ